jgi:hypothetical protein
MLLAMDDENEMAWLRRHSLGLSTAAVALAIVVVIAVFVVVALGLRHSIN